MKDLLGNELKPGDFLVIPSYGNELKVTVASRILESNVIVIHFDELESATATERFAHAKASGHCLEAWRSLFEHKKAPEKIVKVTLPPHELIRYNKLLKKFAIKFT